MTTILIDSEAKRDRASRWLAKIPISETLELTLKPYKPTRSQQANARYWKIIDLIANHTGHDKDELHEMFKNRFLGMQTSEIAGETITHQRSSARLKVAEFQSYMERVESWAIEHLGIWLE